MTEARLLDLTKEDVMAMCDDCGQEMRTAVTCSMRVLVIDGQPYERRRLRRSESDPDGRCGDCGVKPHGVHHYGCDLERCPCCRGQLISCECGWHGDEWERRDVVLVADATTRAGR